MTDLHCLSRCFIHLVETKLSSKGKLLTHLAILLTMALSACNTTSGVLQGVGKDIQDVGKWVDPNPPVVVKRKY